jgi:hypothetical protein
MVHLVFFRLHGQLELSRTDIPRAVLPGTRAGLLIHKRVTSSTRRSSGPVSVDMEEK